MNELTFIAFCINLLLAVMAVRHGGMCNDIKEIKRTLEIVERRGR